MPGNFYSDQLYPLQDKVLETVTQYNRSFYLTGGTALSRVYLHHRYSDDLDFFVNRYEGFQKEATRIINALRNGFDSLEVELADENYIRLMIVHGGIALKCEFINDVEYHVNDVKPSPIFHHTDNWENILSNKICALSRNEEKDMADLLYLSKFFRFNWQQIIEQARQKDLWVNELEVSKHFFDFDLKRLEKIKWITTPDYSALERIKQRISTDIIQGLDNVAG